MEVRAYYRYSSENQRGGVSVAVQRSAVVEYLRAHYPDLEAPTEYIDEAKSGTSLRHRDALKRLLRDAQEGDIIVVHKLDRLGRNLLDSLRTIEELAQRQCRVVSTSEPDVPLVQRILLSVAEDYSRQLGYRCKGALDSIAKEGFASHQAPYGYKLVPVPNSKRKRFEPNPQQAAIVKRIFSARAGGATLHSIITKLNQEKIPSPKGKEWSIHYAHALLKNRAYLGVMIQGRMRYQGQKRVISKQFIETPNAHTAIIDQETWTLVRQHDGAPRNHPVKHNSYLLSGLLLCEYCGRPLIVNPVQAHGKTYRYYGCQNGRNTGQRGACYCRNLINMDSTHAAVLKNLVEQVYSESFIEMVLERCKVALRAQRRAQDDMFPKHQRRLEQLIQAIQVAERRLTVIPEDSLSTFLDELKRLKEERDSLVALVKGGVKCQRPMEQLEVRLRREIAAAVDILQHGDQAKIRAKLVEVIERIEVSKDKTLALTARLPVVGDGITP